MQIVLFVFIISMKIFMQISTFLQLKAIQDIKSIYPTAPKTNCNHQSHILNTNPSKNTKKGTTKKKKLARVENIFSDIEIK